MRDWASHCEWRAGPGAWIYDLWCVDRVQVDGSTVQPRKDHHYLLLNKPIGVVTTVSDPRGRKTVLDLVRSRSVAFIQWAASMPIAQGC